MNIMDAKDLKRLCQISTGLINGKITFIEWADEAELVLSLAAKKENGVLNAC